MEQVIRFIGQLYDVRTKRDGGGRITIDFGAESLEQIMELQRANAAGDTNLAFAVVPVRGHHVEFIPDPETGEIPI